jgi:hypothetical protein
VELHADGGHDGCRVSACAKMGYCALVCIAKNLVGGPHLILPSKVVPGDGLGTWTGFKKDYSLAKVQAALASH